MGEVYRARDTRLQRDVAIKVLPDDFASSPDRLARFEREATTVARLNHPNIVTLFAIEEVAGTRFLTMELSRGRAWQRSSRQADCHSRECSSWRYRSLMPWWPRTRRASCTGISSRPTSW